LKLILFKVAVSTAGVRDECDDHGKQAETDLEGRGRDNKSQSGQPVTGTSKMLCV